MPKKRFSAEQIVTLLRQIEVSMSAGKSTQIACREWAHLARKYRGQRISPFRAYGALTHPP
jgi:hypothetical protein